MSNTQRCQETDRTTTAKSNSDGTTLPVLPPPRHVLHEYCDLCLKKDSSSKKKKKEKNGGLVLQQCADCGVRFHCECYGMVARTQPDPRLQCFACQAIGKTFHVRKRNPETGERIAVTVKERPTECALCGTDNGNEFLHCMHPLFDDHGPCGRQILLPASGGKPQRLAWAHTLCCASISTLSGCVYGCMQDGSYHGEDEDAQDEDDGESVNSALRVTGDDDDDEQADITHYVYLHKKNDERDIKYHEWLKSMEESKHMKCRICNKDDAKQSVYRLTVQCCANDSRELEDFKGSHPNLHGEACYVPLHVGCALWHKEEDGSWPVDRRVFFFPGNDSGSYTQPTANIFCPAHVRDIQIFRKQAFRTPFQKLAPANNKEALSAKIGQSKVAKKRKRLTNDSKGKKRSVVALEEEWDV